MKNKPPESTFLHAIATPLATAMLLTDAALDAAKAIPQARPEEIKRLEKLMKSLNEVSVLLSERRGLLLQE